jgi:hypothetical protein
MIAVRDLFPETGYGQRGFPSFSYSRKLRGTGKDKIHPRTGHEVPEWG